MGILVLVRHLLEIDHGLVAAATETIVFIQNVRKAPGHARSEISSGTTQADQMTPRHVFTAVVPGAFDNCSGSRVANAEALTSFAGEEDLAAGGTIEDGVANDRVFMPDEGGPGVGVDDDLSTGHPFADVIIRFADQLQVNAWCQEGTETLACNAGQLDVDGACGEPFAAMEHGNLTREHGAEGPVGVADRHLDGHLLLAFQRRCRELDQLVVELTFQPMFLSLNASDGNLAIDIGLGENAREIEALILPVFDRIVHLQVLRLTNQFVQCSHTQIGH